MAIQDNAGCTTTLHFWGSRHDVLNHFVKTSFANLCIIAAPLFLLCSSEFWEYQPRRFYLLEITQSVRDFRNLSSLD